MESAKFTADTPSVGCAFCRCEARVGCRERKGQSLHTNNGGEIWREQQSNTEESLLGVYFVNPQTGWVVGTSGLILHTTDAGANWKSQKSGTPKNLRGIAFRNSNEGWAVGEDGLILHTTDAGESWLPQPSEAVWHLLDIYLYKKHAWIVGSKGTILRLG